LTQFRLGWEFSEEMEKSKMKIHGFVLIMVGVAFAFAPAKLSAQGNYTVKLTSPVAGQVLYAGQQVMVEWKHKLPNIALAGCESEAWLSLDGGVTFSMWITFLDPRNTSFLWTVPNTPTNSAVLDIRFGCDLHYPESYAPQPASMFTIAKTQ
jgi:hypothetical protein